VHRLSRMRSGVSCSRRFELCITTKAATLSNNCCSNDRNSFSRTCRLRKTFRPLGYEGAAPNLHATGSVCERRQSSGTVSKSKRKPISFCASSGTPYILWAFSKACFCCNSARFCCSIFSNSEACDFVLSVATANSPSNLSHPSLSSFFAMSARVFFVTPT